MKNKNNKQMTIIGVNGRICSGKGYMIQRYSKLIKEAGKSAGTLSISAIVRDLKASTERIHDASLDEQIVNVAIQEILAAKEEGFDFLFIDGLRQLSIVQSLSVLFDIRWIWLETHSSIRKQRFEARQDERDQLDIWEYDRRDEQLGLLEIFEYIKEFYPQNIIAN